MPSTNPSNPDNSAFFRPHDGDCIACAGSTFKSLGAPILKKGKPSQYSVIECAECGLQRAYPLPTLAELDTFYRNYGDGSRASSIVMDLFRKYAWHPWRNSQVVRLVKKFAPAGPIMDYGCGKGRLIRSLKKAGYPEVIGIDYSHDNVSRLREEGHDVRQGSDPSKAGLTDQSFSCLVASHVIEHLVDPADFMAKAKRLLIPGGVLITAVPSRTSLRARLGESDWHHVDPPNHQWSFDLVSFQHLVERHHFECIYNKNNLLVNELLNVSRNKLNA